MLAYLFTAVLAVIIFFGYKFLNQQGPTKLKIPESSKIKEKTAKPKQQTKKKSNSGSSTPTTVEAKETLKEEKKDTNNKKEEKKEQKKAEQPKVVVQEKEDKKETKKTRKQDEALKAVALEEKKQEAKPDVVTKEEKKESTTASKKSTPVQDKEEKKDQKQQKKEKKSTTDEQEKVQKSEANTKSKLSEMEKPDTSKDLQVAANPVAENHTTSKKDDSEVMVGQKTAPQKFKTVKTKQYSPKVSSPEEVSKVVEKKERINFKSERPKPKEDKEEKKDEPKPPAKLSFTDQDYQEIAKERLESEKKRKDVGVSKKDAGPEVKIFAPVASTKTWSKPEDTTEVTSIDETYFPKLGEKKSKASAAPKQASTSKIEPHQEPKVENPHKRGGELSFEIMIQAPDEKRMKRSSPEEEEHLIPVTFHCTIEPADQSYDTWQMYVIGTCPELGDYQIENGLIMDRSGNVFTATLECFESDEIEYQYAFVDSSDSSKVKHSEKKSFKVHTEPKELKDVFTLQ